MISPIITMHIFIIYNNTNENNFLRTYCVSDPTPNSHKSSHQVFRRTIYGRYCLTSQMKKLKRKNVNKPAQ